MKRRPYPRDLPSDELICLPFLDTDTSRDLPVANAELNARGYSDRLIRLLRAVALPGLWYQSVAWEWASLGIHDVLLGYSILFIIAAPFVTMVSNLLLGTFAWGLVPLTAGFLALGIAWLGMARRRRRMSAMQRGDEI